MLPLSSIPALVVLVGNWFAAADASFAPAAVMTACGQVVMTECWCYDENSCEPDDEPETGDNIPIVEEENILTADYISRNIRVPGDLDLVGRSFEGIDRKAFDNFTNLRSINLDNNKISKLPAFVFSKLKNLERLSLAGNGLRSTKYVFAGLNNLKSLDISDNPLTDVLEDNCFFGLTETCDITIRGVKHITKIGSDAFGRGSSKPPHDFKSKASEDIKPKSKSIHERSVRWTQPSEERVSRSISSAIVCIQDGTLLSVDYSDSHAEMGKGCKEISYSDQTLDIAHCGVSKFKKGWFHLRNEKKVPDYFSTINLKGNNITRVTSEVVNDLPGYIISLNLEQNKIERLEKGTFVHEHIFMLHLSDNSISEIEDDTFDMPKLEELYLEENRLKDTKFVATLPSSLTTLDLQSNEISEISANSFSNLKRLRYLYLHKNRITTLQSQCLSGATSLNSLLLFSNRIATIEEDAFDGLDLETLHLGDNDITSLSKGVFTRLTNLQRLSLPYNNLTKISNQMFDLPRLMMLELNHNYITTIEKGATKKLGSLEVLNLSYNNIERLENGALFGLNKRRKTYVHIHETPIEIIQGGLFDDV